MLPGVKGANANHNFVTTTAESENVAQTPVNSEKQSRHSRLQDMKQFLASFNQQQEATRQVLSELSAKKKPKALRHKHLQTHKEKLAAFLASDDHFENSSSSMSPSQSSWIESLRRMREGKARTRKTLRGSGTQDSQTPTSIRQICPVEVKEKERLRLARRLSTLTFPMKACLAALEESDGDVEKSVALLLRWYPKGSGGRSAVHKLVQIILGAEKKLRSMRSKLQILYAPALPAKSNRYQTQDTSASEGDMTEAVRAIFNNYDKDASGTIDHTEFRRMLSDLGVDMTNDEFREAVTMLDSDHNGEIDFDEFLGWWKQNAGDGVVLSDDIDALFQHVLQEAKTLVSAEKASLFLVNSVKGELWTRVADCEESIHIPISSGIVGKVVETAEALNVPDAHMCPYFNPEIDKKTGFITKQVLAVPISVVTDQPNSQHATRQQGCQGPETGSQRRVVGVVEVMNSLNDRSFSDDAVSKMQQLAERISHGVYNVARLQEQEEGPETAPKDQNQAEDTTRTPFLAHLTMEQRHGLPRPASSPERRRHTMSATSLHQGAALTSRKRLASGKRYTFGDISEYTQQQRISVMLYQQNQAARRNQQRPDRVSRIATILDKYDRDNGIKRLSPKRKQQILWGKNANQGRNTRSMPSLLQRQQAQGKRKQRKARKWFKGLTRSQVPGR